MICPHCGETEEGGAGFCSKCGNSFNAEPDVRPDVKPPGRGSANIWMIIATVCIAAVLIGACVFFYIVPHEKGTKVTLRDPYGNPLGSVSVVPGSRLIDIEQLEAKEDSIGTKFAGWYTDESLETPFNKFTTVTSSITLYSDWNDLSFDLVQNEKAIPNNTKDCTFTNTTTADPPNSIVSTTWTIVDSFKSNNNKIVTKALVTAPAMDYSRNLNKGMYDVTMTVTFDDGAGGTFAKSKTVSKVVDGEISSTASWNDYSGVPRTLTLKFDTDDYIEFAKKNWKRSFYIPDIANFAEYGSDAILGIKHDLEIMFDNGGTPLSKQDQANLLASFVNNGIGTSGSTKDYDYYYYQLPGLAIGTPTEYYKYPLESLYDMAINGSIGDCDDHAILTAAIAKACGFDSSIIVMTKAGEEGHAVAGIKDDGTFVPPAPQPTPVPGNSSAKSVFTERDGYYGCETFRYSFKLLIGNVQGEYQGPGWNVRVFVVR